MVIFNESLLLSLFKLINENISIYICYGICMVIMVWFYIAFEIFVYFGFMVYDHARNIRKKQQICSKPLPYFQLFFSFSFERRKKVWSSIPTSQYIIYVNLMNNLTIIVYIVKNECRFAMQAINLFNWNIAKIVFARDWSINMKSTMKIIKFFITKIQVKKAWEKTLTK